MAIFLMASTEAAPDPDWTLLETRFLLTLREIVVMAGIWHGHKYLAIAAHMDITKHGVDAHWRSIKTKMKVRDHKDAIRLIAQTHWQAWAEAQIAMHTPKMLPAPEVPLPPTGYPQS